MFAVRYSLGFAGARSTSVMGRRLGLARTCSCVLNSCLPRNGSPRWSQHCINTLHSAKHKECNHPNLAMYSSCTVYKFNHCKQCTSLPENHAILSWVNKKISYQFSHDQCLWTSKVKGNFCDKLSFICPTASVVNKISFSTTSHANTKPVQQSELSEKRSILKRDDVLTVPNLLTGIRIGLTPVLGYLVLHDSFAWACGVFVVAGITDILDGWIARNFVGQTSAFGSFLDPLADKFLISVLFITLTMVDLIPMPLTGLIIYRDVCLIVAAFYVRYISLSPPITLTRFFDVTNPSAQLQPMFISKLNTAVQLSLVTFTLAAPVFDFVGHPALQTLWFVTAATTLGTGIAYIFAKDTYKILSKARGHKS